MRLLHREESASLSESSFMGASTEVRESFRSLSFYYDFVVGAVRVELTTSSLSEMRSNQLSYAPEQVST